MLKNGDRVAVKMMVKNGHHLAKGEIIGTITDDYEKHYMLDDNGIGYLVTELGDDRCEFFRIGGILMATTTFRVLESKE